MREVEMKAWVDEPQALRACVEARYRYLRDFDRHDQYFIGPAPEKGDRPQYFRLRRDIRRDGAEWICTFKDKTIRDGLEINAEHEFNVSNERSFNLLMHRLGARAWVTKHKKGRVYEVPVEEEGIEMIVELSEVAHLGHFIEVECLISDDDAERTDLLTAHAETLIRSLLSELAISPERIEARPYTRMLQERAAG